jgi:hypothetical protein
VSLDVRIATKDFKAAIINMLTQLKDVKRVKGKNVLKELID